MRISRVVLLILAVTAIAYFTVTEAVRSDALSSVASHRRRMHRIRRVRSKSDRDRSGGVGNSKLTETPKPDPKKNARLRQDDNTPVPHWPMPANPKTRCEDITAEFQKNPWEFACENAYVFCPASSFVRFFACLDLTGVVLCVGV